MAFPLTLSDWQTAIASGVKIETLLQSSTETKAVVHETTAGRGETEVQDSTSNQLGQTASVQDKDIAVNLNLHGLSLDPLFFRWSEPSTTSSVSPNHTQLLPHFAVDTPALSASQILELCFMGDHIQVKNEEKR